MLMTCSPYIFLTNGGGKTEAERCVDLSRQLDIEVSPAQFICGMNKSQLILDIISNYHRPYSNARDG
jgi:ribonucleotide monophosphatase NagD (HAD superfamily)